MSTNLIPEIENEEFVGCEIYDRDAWTGEINYDSYIPLTRQEEHILYYRPFAITKLDMDESFKVEKWFLTNAELRAIYDDEHVTTFSPFSIIGQFILTDFTSQCIIQDFEEIDRQFVSQLVNSGELNPAELFVGFVCACYREHTNLAEFIMDKLLQYYELEDLCEHLWFTIISLHVKSGSVIEWIAKTYLCKICNSNLIVANKIFAAFHNDALKVRYVNKRACITSFQYVVSFTVDFDKWCERDEYFFKQFYFEIFQSSKSLIFMDIMTDQHIEIVSKTILHKCRTIAKIQKVLKAYGYNQHLNKLIPIEMHIAPSLSLEDNGAWDNRAVRYERYKTMMGNINEFVRRIKDNMKNTDVVLVDYDYVTEITNDIIDRIDNNGGYYSFYIKMYNPGDFKFLKKVNEWLWNARNSIAMRKYSPESLRKYFIDELHIDPDKDVDSNGKEVAFELDGEVDPFEKFYNQYKIAV